MNLKPTQIQRRLTREMLAFLAIVICVIMCSIGFTWLLLKYTLVTSTVLISGFLIVSLYIAFWPTKN